MGIMTRMLRLWKADLHGVMDQLEDKGLLLKQHLREMERSLQHKKVRLTQLTQTCQQIQNDILHRDEEMDKLEKEIALAVQKDKDNIAKMLIRKRRTQQAACDHLQRQRQIVEAEKERLSEVLDQQQLQYEELKVKVTAFCQHTEQRRFEDAATVLNQPSGLPIPSEEEIELELLQRKEALQGGAL